MFLIGAASLIYMKVFLLLRFSAEVFGGRGLGPKENCGSREGGGRVENEGGGRSRLHPGHHRHLLCTNLKGSGW